MSLRLIPFGGLGEIGKNMMGFFYDEDLIIVDAGVMFPKEEQLGIDLIIPDIRFLEENRNRIKAIFLTHGHEDHIGALPFILPKLNVPVYGTRLTLALVKSKLKEFYLPIEPDFREILPNAVVSCGKMSVSFFPNVHSIYDGIGIVIETPAGTVVHTGDFKFDQTPMAGMFTDFKRLTDLGSRGVLLLLSDSTYADRPGSSDSEKSVRKSFEAIFSNAKGRVIVAAFASSIPRIQQIVDSAKTYHRKVAFVGKRMIENVAIARELGYLMIKEDEILREEELSTSAHESIAVITTGSQGEPFSALTLMAAKSHKSVEIIKGDTVVISATPIPGNESLVYRVVNQLYRLGAEVVFNPSVKSDASLKVHVQGHAGQEELKLLMNLLHPRFFIPIHGEYRQLVHHARLAREVGIPEKNILIAVDGDIVEISDQEIRVVDRLPLVPQFVHGYGVGEIGKSIMKERRALGEEGVLVLGLTLHKETLKLAAEPEVVSRGFIGDDSELAILEETKKITREFFNNGALKKNRDPEILKGNLKGELNKFFGETMGRKPIIIPVLTMI